MKALQRNFVGRRRMTLVSAAVLTLGLVGWGRLDLIAEPFGPAMVFGRLLSSAAMIHILYRSAYRKKPVLVPVPVRA